ncbi:High-affinity branched-chain amino acid transport ATP-binding protein LivF [Xylophilus ampelinus]|nr:High-affinity branched-chain amino acid transport ATP-binding protein LivF [Xylophilus ampelinus]
MPENVLLVDRVHVGYGDAEVLRGASLRLGRGEIVGIIGPNGVGKTTMLKSIAGLLRLRGGTVHAFGLDVRNTEPLDLRLAGLGYVPQERNVFPNLGVRENLETAYRVAGAKARSVDLAERLGFVEGLFPRLAQRRAQHAGLMSGGEQRMVALAMGLMLEPRALLLDEPTTGLAPVVVHELMRTISRLRDTAGISILLVEQNIASMVKVVDRLYVVKDGVCREFDGPPEDLARLNIWEYL